MHKDVKYLDWKICKDGRHRAQAKVNEQQESKANKAQMQRETKVRTKFATLCKLKLTERPAS